MADLKISQLTEATNPIGTDVLPIVNDGTTKKVTLNTIRSGFSGGSDISQLSANWQNAFNTVLANSAINWNYQGTDLKDLSANWESTYTTVQTNSSNWVSAGSNSFLPLSGGTIQGVLNVVGNISASNSQVIDTNSSSSNPALRITQRGTGAALLVEDTTNPDSSPFSVLNNGTLLIGASAARQLTFTGTPNNSIEISRTSSFPTPTIELRTHGTTSSILQFLRFSSLNTNDFETNSGMPSTTIASFRFGGQIGEGNTDTNLASISVINKYSVTSGLDSDVGTRMSFVNRVSGVGTTTVLSLNEDKVGINVLSPNEALTVVGNISATGTLQLSLTSTPPSNTTTPAAWTDIVVGNITYKTPLYL